MATKSCTGNARVWLLATLAGLAVTPVAMADKAVGTPSRTVPSINRLGVLSLADADATLAPGQETIAFSDRMDCTSSACIGSVLPNATAPGIPFQGESAAIWSDFGNAAPLTNPIRNIDTRVTNNFTPNVTGNITEICWVGRYTAYLTGADPAQTTPPTAFGVLPPASRTFRVSYYNDAGGLPCATPFAQFVVGATNPTAGTTFTQVGPLSTNTTLNATHRWTAQHPAVAVTANTCVWVEIIDVDISANVTINAVPGYSRCFRWICTLDQSDAGPTAGPNTRPVDNRFFWGGFNAGTADGVPYGADEEELTAGDPMFCVNLASIVTAGAGACPNIPTLAPANDNIGSPQALTINAAPTNGTTFGATQELGGVRPCGISMGDSTGVWYSVIGNGQTLTVSTDLAGNCTDTEMIVYDASTFAGNANDLRCIGDSDDASATLGSAVEFCSQAGTQYLIYVAGVFAGGDWADGGFRIQATSSGACTPASPSLNCDVVATGTDELEQNEACGGGVDVNGDCGGNPDVFFPGTITIGGPAKVGSVETIFQTSRDRDAYNFTTAGAVELSVTLTSEFPALLFLIECTGNPPTVDDPNAEQLFGILVPTCITEEAVQVLVPRAGNWIFFVMPSKFGGLEDCSLNFNQYRLSASIAAPGACCTGDACSLAQAVGCENNNGRFLGNGILCTPNECEPTCTVALSTPAEAESCLLDPTTSVNDSCASNAGTLAAGTPVYGTLSTSATVDGNFRDLDAWAFTQAATGDVAITLEAESNVLFQVINCADESVVAGSTTELNRCTTTATTLTALPAGNYIVILTTQDFGGAPCTSGVNNYKLTLGGGGAPTPCQIADFNDSGSVTADDIFAFLDAWFVQNGQVGPGLTADVNFSNSVTADDIFAYLDLWFAQNGQSCN